MLRPTVAAFVTPGAAHWIVGRSFYFTKGTEMNIEPKVGQWWRNRAGEIAYVALDFSVTRKGGSDFPVLCCTEDEVVYWVKKNGCSSLSEREDDEDLVEHLPDCTGFDWVPEKWPKYFIPKERRASLSCGKTIAYYRWDGEVGTTVHKDGSSFMYAAVLRVFDGDIEVTESEALSRVKPAKRRLKLWTPTSPGSSPSVFFHEDPGPGFMQVFCDADGFYVEGDR